MVVRLRLLAAVAILAAAVACDAPTVPREDFAYDPRLPGGLVYHWPSGSKISVYVDRTSEPAGANLREAVVEGFQLWSRVIHYADFELRLVDQPADAQVIFHHRDAPFLVDVDACIYPDVGAGGITYFCPTELGDELEILPLLAGGPGRVKMDVRVDRSRVPDETRFRALVAHEIGHVLGIGSHSAVADDLMFGGIVQVPIPSERDARTLRWVLRQPVDLLP